MSDLKAEGLIRNAFKRSLKRFTSMLSSVLTIYCEHYERYVQHAE